MTMSWTRLITSRHFPITRFGLIVGLGFMSYARGPQQKQKGLQIPASHDSTVFPCPQSFDFSRVGWPVMTDSKRELHKEVSNCTKPPNIKFNVIDKTTIESRHANRERISKEKQSGDKSWYDIFGEDECLEYARRCAISRDYILGADMYHDIKSQLNESNDYIGCWMYVSPNVKDNIILSIDIIIADSEGDIFKEYVNYYS